MTKEIAVKNLKKVYSGGTIALENVSLEVDKSAIFALLGPNGAGKSTLVNILTTLRQKDSGELLINSIDPDANFSEIQKYIGVASQDNEIDPTEIVQHLLYFQARIFGMDKQKAKERSQSVIKLFKLEKECKKRAGELSGGNKRRLHCALAMIHSPRLLFLDEPTVGMDPEARSIFWEIISDLNKTEKTTVFLTTQYLEEADKHASEMALLIEGRIQYKGTVAEFKKMVDPIEHLSLEDSYLMYIKRLRN